jgi:hypothetical protein
MYPTSVPENVRCAPGRADGSPQSEIRKWIFPVFLWKMLFVRIYFSWIS